MEEMAGNAYSYIGQIPQVGNSRSVAMDSKGFLEMLFGK